MWNAGHAWASFAHQIHHGFHNEQAILLHLDFLASYALFLVVLVSPVLGLLCFRSAVGLSNERHRFLASFSGASSPSSATLPSRPISRRTGR